MGVPGALSNQPPGAAAAPITVPVASGVSGVEGAGGTPVRRGATTNYEVDRTIQHVRQQTGALKRVTAAVVVNFKRTTTADGNAKMTPLSEQEMQQLDKLVREAMGFTQARGDSVQVVNASFADTAGSKAALQDRLLDYASKRHRNLRLHLSVQAAAATPEAIAFYADTFGVKRVVMPRVLSVEEIAKLNAAINVETEAFVFGGLCPMTEGRCSLSSYATGKSPNLTGVCSPPEHVAYSEDKDGTATTHNAR